VCPVYGSLINVKRETVPSQSEAVVRFSQDGDVDERVGYLRQWARAYQAELVSKRRLLSHKSGRDLSQEILDRGCSDWTGEQIADCRRKIHALAEKKSRFSVTSSVSVTPQSAAAGLRSVLFAVDESEAEAESDEDFGNVAVSGAAASSGYRRGA
jgi:hypothetical protein